MAGRNQLLNDQETAMRDMLDGRLSSLWSACPGIVKAVDLTKMVVSVQPAIQGAVTLEDGVEQFVNLPLLINVPIVFPSAGGFTLTLPIAVEDEVLVVFGARCIDAWWQSGGIQKPMEARMHDLSDGFAIPGPKSQPKKISGISATGAQLRNNAGTSYIEMSADGKIKIVSPVAIEFTGNLNITGNVVATQVTASGVALSTHVHSGVTPGGGSSGPPV